MSAKSAPAWSAASRIDNFGDVKQGDVIEAFAMQRVANRNGVMAVVGVLTLELRIEHAHSLKEKRHVVKSLKDRLRGKFNVSVAEIDDQDLHNSAVIAVATVSPSRPFAEKILQAVEREAADLLGPC